MRVYAVPTLLAQHVTILQQAINISPDANVVVRSLLWNPVMPATIAIVLDNGSMCALAFNGAGGGAAYEMHSLPPAEQVLCASWSPKGKQIVCGHPDGRLSQYKPDLKLARSIAAPPAGTFPTPFDCIAVQWLSTYQFAAAWLRRAAGECPALVVVTAPKAGAVQYVNYDDVCYSQSGPRAAQMWFEHVLPWNLLLVASANSMEVAVLGTADGGGDAPQWTQYTMADEARAEVPLTEGREEAYPVGWALETGCTHRLVEAERELEAPMPMLHVLSTAGALVSFDLVNRRPGVATLCQAPKSVPDRSGEAEWQRGECGVLMYNNSVKDIQIFVVLLYFSTSTFILNLILLDLVFIK